MVLLKKEFPFIAEFNLKHSKQKNLYLNIYW
jgi:hypothetical protein